MYFSEYFFPLRINLMQLKPTLLFTVLSSFIISTFFITGCKKNEVSSPAPSISGFSPVISGIGYPVTITGGNFSTDASSDKVTINGAPATVVSATETKLIVTVPLEASSGKISVLVNGQTITTSSDITIKKLTVTTIAGSVNGFSDGTGTAAAFSGPWGIAGDHNGNYFIVDTYNNRVRKMTSAGVVTTLTGTGSQGNIDGDISIATFGLPFGAAMDSQGNLFVTHTLWNNIRKITPGGMVSTFAGDLYAAHGTADGTGTSARFYMPLGIAIDGNDNIYVADSQNSLIRKITSAGVVSTVAGTGIPGSADGNGQAASFNTPWGITTDPDGNLFILDPGNSNIRKITPNGDVTTFAGNGSISSLDGPALSASFNGLIGMVRDQNGNFYVTDENANTIRMITTDGIVVTLAGNGDQVNVDGVGGFASFNHPLGITIDPDGVMYMTDNGSNTVRKMVVN
jgi:sugar lactone lactonase YvrE